MIVQILTTGEENFGWILKNTDAYRHVHDIRVSDHPDIFFGGYNVGISFMHQHRVSAEQVNAHPWINFHPGPLPAYKGRNLCYHALMNGAETFGASVHYMDENFDTGDIIDVWRFEIEEHWTAQDLFMRTILESEKMFKNFFPRILAGEDFIRLPNVGGMYYKKEKIDDFVHSKTNMNPEYISQQIRAIYFPPHYPKIEIGGVTYKIVKDE